MTFEKKEAGRGWPPPAKVFATDVGMEIIPLALRDSLIPSKQMKPVARIAGCASVVNFMSNIRVQQKDSRYLDSVDPNAPFQTPVSWKKTTSAMQNSLHLTADQIKEWTPTLSEISSKPAPPPLRYQVTEF